jgi:hypothetical protein
MREVDLGVEHRRSSNPDQVCEVCGYMGEGILCSSCVAKIGVASDEVLQKAFEKAMVTGRVVAASWFGQLIDMEVGDYELREEGETADEDRGSIKRDVGAGVPRAGQAGACSSEKTGNAVHSSVKNTSSVSSFSSFGMAEKAGCQKWV